MLTAAATAPSRPPLATTALAAPDGCAAALLALGAAEPEDEEADEDGEEELEHVRWKERRSLTAR
jgi:hypothetical protein